MSGQRARLNYLREARRILGLRGRPSPAVAVERHLSDPVVAVASHLSEVVEHARADIDQMGYRRGLVDAMRMLERVRPLGMTREEYREIHRCVMGLGEGRPSQGDVVQIHEDADVHESLRGQLALVTEPKAWGCIVGVDGPAVDGVAYARVSDGQYTTIGSMPRLPAWAVPSVDPDA